MDRPTPPGGMVSRGIKQRDSAREAHSHDTVVEAGPHAGKRLDAELIELDEQVFLLVAWDLGQKPQRTVALTAAEEAILQLICKGYSNAEIAKRRGTALRTVANQVAALLRKHGVQSRHEL